MGRLSPQSGIPCTCPALPQSDPKRAARRQAALEHGQRPNILSAGADVGTFFHYGIMDAPFHDLFAVLIEMN